MLESPRLLESAKLPPPLLLLLLLLLPTCQCYITLNQNTTVDRTMQLSLYTLVSHAHFNLLDQL